MEGLVVAEAPLVRIRLKHAEDALNDYRWRRDPELTAFDGAAPLSKSFGEFVTEFERELAFPDPSRRAYTLVEPGGQQIGSVTWYNASPGRESAELGISICEADFRDRGVGRQAMVAFLRYLWGAHPFQTLYLHALDWNLRAIGCFRKAGFAEVGRIVRGEHTFRLMEVRREWWLLWDGQGRFEFERGDPGAATAAADRAR